ncbi:hypothetical protein CW304_11880 [Bacillus sp. UFRGS-B20]|nr:hypothetical protein CW304_11880 [Bacillus sp. UFRGS-B20]
MAGLWLAFPLLVWLLFQLPGYVGVFDAVSGAQVFGCTGLFLNVTVCPLSWSYCACHYTPFLIHVLQITTTFFSFQRQKHGRLKSYLLQNHLFLLPVNVCSAVTSLHLLLDGLFC